jgi:alpha-beta hydrolase superfamily lysophospholipase
MKRRTALVLAGFGCALIVAFAAGPRPKVDFSLRPPALPADLDSYLASEEARVPDLIPGTEKTIHWAEPAKSRTPLAVVHLHGFAASRQETAPLCDRVANRLGANLFYGRLAGHGLSTRHGEALAEATINDWLNDTVTALAIGRRLGRRIVVIGFSTGGTLATWLAEQPRGDDVLAYVLMSPNFGPRDKRAELFTWPWAGQLLPMIVGAEQSWEPDNDAQARYWTHRYPTRALVPMVGLVDLVRESPLESITAPVLVIYSPLDTIVDPEATRAAFARFGSPVKKLVPVIQRDNPGGHVIAGDIRAPNHTDAVADVILDFLATLQ